LNKKESDEKIGKREEERVIRGDMDRLICIFCGGEAELTGR